MARRSSKKSAEGALILIVLVSVALVAGAQAIVGFLHKYWLFIAVIASVMLFLSLLGRLFSKPEGRTNRISPSKTDRSPKKQSTVPPVVSAEPPVRRIDPASRVEPPAQAKPASQPFSFSIPKAASAPPRWVPAGEAVTVRGFEIEGGMVYVGINGSNPDALLIDPSLEVRTSGTSNSMGYWPSYANASPENRGEYLKWLSGGKNEPDADIGLVFLYFYGLERRVLADAETNPAVASELPPIEAEVIRLQGIYSDNHSFRSYSDSLIGFVKAARTVAGGLPETVTDFAKAWEIPFVLKVGLARFVVQEAPIPGEWAYAWWLADPSTRLKTASERCPGEFKQLFIEYYSQKFKPGLRLRPNKTRLAAVHRVASPSLPRRQYERVLDLPDVTVLTAPMKKLQEVADCCHQALDRYSRHLGRKPQNAGKIDALLELPTLLWPDAMRQPLLKIHGMVSQSGIALAVKFDRLLSMLPPWETVNKASYSAFASSLAQIGLGIEPDPQYGGAMPESGQTVVLFVGEPSSLMSEPSQSYRTAALSLQFAASVSHADGEFGEMESEAMIRQMGQWLHLGEGERARLQAYLRWLATEPPTLNGLKKRVDEMPVPAREALGDFLVLVAKADESVSPQEVKLLERIFKMLGLDVQPLYGKLHAPASEPVTIRPGAGQGQGHAIPRPKDASNGGMRLDMDKVSGLQEDTRRVSELLNVIFGKEAEPDSASEPSQAASEAEIPGLLGLKGECDAFARLLVTRNLWKRAELEELAADRSLLLDGTLEQINEAAFDQFGQALVEDGDPFEINQEIAGEMTA